MGGGKAYAATLSNPNATDGEISGHDRYGLRVHAFEPCRPKYSSGQYCRTSYRLLWKAGLTRYRGKRRIPDAVGWNSVISSMSQANFNLVTTPGTPEYNKWLAHFDTIAGYLKQL
ncbi:hypothetical protein [Paenibacillus periandrae]|uniref:hypothetical protein n=1 Tax=Paenibacillus periandrae TaxID=1761741 RepID=UPI001F0908DB|nr:hypothetical protein [Paenibacillus periandrae]